MIEKCKLLLEAYKTGKLGQTVMPEDSHPTFIDQEEKLAYFTLPMSLNYQRDSYVLWKSALATFNDPGTNQVFNIYNDLSEGQLRIKLLKHKLALQPNKHTNTWKTISNTVLDNWGSFTNLLNTVDKDFLRLRITMQRRYKKGFPYISGPKIFNYWCFILTKYCNIDLKNSEHISIAPDTHITKCSVKLGLISEEEASSLTKEQIADRWRRALAGSGIKPIDMHAPLWFWSRNGFLVDV